jgi:hypothetical protein
MRTRPIEKPLTVIPDEAKPRSGIKESIFFSGFRTSAAGGFRNDRMR